MNWAIASKVLSITLIPLSSNPLMEMQDKSLLLNAIEKILGVSCIVTMIQQNNLTKVTTSDIMLA